MSKEVDWTKSIYERFCAEAMLSELEREIMRTRILGWSRTKQALHFNLSLSAVDRIVSNLKRKYDAASKECDDLPARNCRKPTNK